MVKLYSMIISHPSQAAVKMLDQKGVEYELVNVVPLNQRLHLRLAGFREGTVPALKLDGERIQGSRQIARALDRRWPSPPLFPAEPELRARVQEAERWGEQELQAIPRRLARFGAARHAELRRWAAESQSLPAPGLVAGVTGPIVSWYGRCIEPDGRRADAAGVRADLAALPTMLDHVDQLLQDGTRALEPPNAASLQILSTMRSLSAFADLQELIASRPCVAAARTLFPRYPGPLPPFLAPEWLEPLRAAQSYKPAASASSST